MPPYRPRINIPASLSHTHSLSHTRTLSFSLSLGVCVCVCVVFGEGRGVRYSNRIVESYSAETCVLACRRGSSFVVKELIRASRKGRYDKVEIAKPKEYVDLLDKEVDLHG